MDSQETQSGPEHVHTSTEVESAMSGRIVPTHTYKQAGDETLPQEPDEWPERHLAVSIGPTRLVVGRMTIIDAGQGWVKVELDTPCELEAELLPPAEARTFINWLMEINKRYLN